MMFHSPSLQLESREWHAVGNIEARRIAAAAAAADDDDDGAAA